jgi:hypothetical protein
VTDGLSASVPWCRASVLNLWPDFSFLSGNCGFLDVVRPLWREDGSVIFSYNCFWALPEQLLSGQSPAELTTILYCLIWDSPNLEGQVPVFISPGNRVAQLYPRALSSLYDTPLTTRRATVEVFYPSPNLKGQVPVFISSGNRVAQLYPRALGSLYDTPLTTRRATVWNSSRMLVMQTRMLRCHIVSYC